MRRSSRSLSLVRAAGVAAITILVVIVGFQAALALGAPLGEAAWGGGSAELSTGLRFGSGVAVLIWGFATLVVFQRSGLGDAHLNAALVTRGTWILFALTVLGCLANWASRSAAERYTWGPTTLVLAALLFVVARSTEPQQGRPRSD